MYMYDGKLGTHVTANLTSQETLNCLVLENYGRTKILVIYVLIQVKKRSLHLSVHS